MSQTQSLQYLGNQILPTSFIGVFAKDTLPTVKRRHQMFILNTDTANLPGKHWVAVIVRNGEGYYFDPLGFPPPLKVITWLNRYSNRWTSSTRQVQTYISQLCGHFCLQFLYFASSHSLKDVRFDDIVSLIYPKKFPLIDYEKMVLDFSKLHI